MNIELILTVTSLHFLALISPGPDFVLTLRNALQFGRKMGFATAVGFGLGIALHASYSICGVALLIKESPRVFVAIKVLGALYLIWLGLSALMATTKSRPVHDIETNQISKPQSLITGLRQGFLTNILNPKATLFTLGLFTTVIPIGTNLATMVTCGIIMSVITVLWFMAVSALFSVEKIRMGYLKAERVLNFLFAIFFLLTGVLILK